MKTKFFLLILFYLIFSSFTSYSASIKNNNMLNNHAKITVSFSFKLDKNSITFTPYSIMKDIKFYNTEISIKAAVILYVTLAFLIPIGGCLIIAGIPLVAIGGYNDYHNMEDKFVIPYYASGAASLGVGHALLIPTMVCGIIVGANLK